MTTTSVSILIEAVVPAVSISIRHHLLVTHIGLYCGVYRGPITEFNGKRVFVSAVSDGPKTGVQLTLISERFWKNHFFGYGRILPRTKIQAQNTKTQNARVQKK